MHPVSVLPFGALVSGYVCGRVYFWPADECNEVIEILAAFFGNWFAATIE